MNRTRIEWVTNPDGSRGFTWNPEVGCSRGCTYCYARWQAKRQKNKCPLCYDFTVHVHTERYDQPKHVRKPSTIFTCSQGELFDPKMSEWGILDILDVIRSCPQHRFLVLTKNPSRLFDFKIPSNCGVGVSIDGKYQTTGLDELARCEAGMKFVSFEPLLAPVNPSVLYTYLRSLFPIMYNPVDWVIIGGQSRTPTCKKFVPPYWWVMPIIEKARKIGVPVFLKNNLEWDEPVREYPDFLRIGD